MNPQDSHISNVFKFRALVDADPKLQDEVQQHVNRNGWDASAIAEIGRGKGLDFSAGDIASVLQEDDELSDFELEMVAAALPVPCGDT